MTSKKNKSGERRVQMKTSFFDFEYARSRATRKYFLFT